MFHPGRFGFYIEPEPACQEGVFVLRQAFSKKA